MLLMCPYCLEFQIAKKMKTYHNVFFSPLGPGAVGRVLGPTMRGPLAYLGIGGAACRPSCQSPWEKCRPKFAGIPHQFQKAQNFAGPGLQRSPGTRINAGFRQLLAKGSLWLWRRGSVCA